jgi:hypothetical protein
MGWIAARRLVLGLLAGGAVGFVYQRLVGCRTGTCPLTATPLRAILYGAFVGALMAMAGQSHP